jgi:hypothetical protein
VAVPQLQQLGQQLAALRARVAAAAAAALGRAAEGLLGAYGSLKALVAAVAELDVLAGFAQVWSVVWPLALMLLLHCCCCRPCVLLWQSRGCLPHMRVQPQVVASGVAPPGCTFSRPRFAAAGAAGAASSSARRGPAAAAQPQRMSSPLLRFHGLWHPLMALQGCARGAVLPNDGHLGGEGVPGAMLLTGVRLWRLVCAPGHAFPRGCLEGTCTRSRVTVHQPTMCALLTNQSITAHSGVNMRGKSTLLRATCLGVIMAQVWRAGSCALLVWRACTHVALLCQQRSQSHVHHDVCHEGAGCPAHQHASCCLVWRVVCQCACVVARRWAATWRRVQRCWSQRTPSSRALVSG